MSRVPLNEVVRLKAGPVVPGTRLYVYERGTTTQVTGYTTEAGGTTVSYPLLANVEGRFPAAWYPTDSYDLYSPDDDLNPTQPWEAVNGADVAVPGRDVWFGRTANTTTPDFWWDYDNEKLQVRSVLIRDVGDSPDLVLGRAGPDDIAQPKGAWTDPPEALGTNVVIGSLYWQAHDGTDWDGSAGGQNKAAHIYARTTQAQTPTARGVKIVLATTPNGTDTAFDRVTVGNDGKVNFHRIADGELGANLYGFDTGVLFSDHQFVALGALGTKVKAGAPVDGDVVRPADGTIVVDETNDRLYVRVGGDWRYAALT